MAKSKAESSQPNLENNISYTTAIEELEAIVADIENEEISVDDLAEKVKRASLLIKICKEKLTKTEDEVNEALKDLKAGGAAEDRE